MKRIQFILLFLLFLTDVVFPQRNPEITAKELKTDVYFLASDSLKGRKPGTKEGNVAAGYIREQFKASGLKLICDNGFQYFEIVQDVTVGEHNNFRFEDFQGTLKKDFMPVAYSSNGTISSSVVFAGYGFDIDQDSLKWKDYEGVDVKGKWVMLFRGDP
jgi:hypothetical protein